TTRFSFGDEESRLGEFAWFQRNTRYDRNTIYIEEDFAHQVRLKSPNSFGLFDMHGNVSEWCDDFFAIRLPGGTDPLVSRARRIFVLVYQDLRVTRGGSWTPNAASLSPASRSYHSAGRYDRPDVLANAYTGFRVARSPAVR